MEVFFFFPLLWRWRVRRWDWKPVDGKRLSLQEMPPAREWGYGYRARPFPVMIHAICVLSSCIPLFFFYMKLWNCRDIFFVIWGRKVKKTDYLLFVVSCCVIYIYIFLLSYSLHLVSLQYILPTELLSLQHVNNNNNTHDLQYLLYFLLSCSLHLTSFHFHTAL